MTPLPVLLQLVSTEVQNSGGNAQVGLCIAEAPRPAQDGAAPLNQGRHCQHTACQGPNGATAREIKPNSYAVGIAQMGGFQIPFCAFADRKSTRLNSSHA